MTSTSPPPTDAPLPRLGAWILCLFSFLIFPNKGVGLTYPLIFPPGDAQRAAYGQRTRRPAPAPQRDATPIHNENSGAVFNEFIQ